MCPVNSDLLNFSHGISAYLLTPLNSLLLFLYSSPSSGRLLSLFFFFKDFVFRERGREEERGGEKHRSAASRTPLNQEPGLQPRHVPWPGIESVLSFCRMMPNPLNHTGLGWLLFFPTMFYLALICIRTYLVQFASSSHRKDLLICVDVSYIPKGQDQLFLLVF